MIDTSEPIDRTGNKYCGPLVIAAITGKTTAEAAAAIRKHTRPTGSIVKGVYPTELIRTLKALGHTVTCVSCLRHVPTRYGYTSKAVTLKEWLKGSRSPWLPYVIMVTHHCVIVQGNRICDTFTEGKWTLLTAAPPKLLRKRVASVWQVAK